MTNAQVILGITIHQNAEDNLYNRLKDNLHFSQLLFAFKHLRPGT